MWVPTTELPVSPGHLFYAKLNTILDEAGFDRFAEAECQQFYAPVMGRPSLPPGRYFRLLLVGYFEGLDSERGIAWRAADSLAVRSFVGLDTPAPDHSTISRTRRLIALETHRAVFTWVQERLAATGLLKGRTVAIDATTLEANAAMRSIVRRDTGETYQEFLKGDRAAGGAAAVLALLAAPHVRLASARDGRADHLHREPDGPCEADDDARPLRPLPAPRRSCLRRSSRDAPYRRSARGPQGRLPDPRLDRAHR
jgi:transposase